MRDACPQIPTFTFDAPSFKMAETLESCSRVRGRRSSLSYQARKLRMALLYRRTVPGARSLARNSASHSSSRASVGGNVIRVLLAFFRLFPFFHLFFSAVSSISYG